MIDKLIEFFKNLFGAKKGGEITPPCVEPTRKPIVPKSGYVPTVEVPQVSTAIRSGASGAYYVANGQEVPLRTKNLVKALVKNRPQIVSVVIPDCVETIGDDSFSDCKSLKSVVIGRGVKHIGNAAFARCESLEVIRIPEGVTQIGCQTNHNSYVGGGTFSNCKSLKEIYLPASLTYVSKCYGIGLKFCPSLRAILIPKGTTAKIAPLLEPEVLDKLYEI